MTPFGLKLRELRKKHNMTQATLAKKLAVSAPYLSALERGKRGAPPRRIVLRVIEIFGLIWDEAEKIEQLAQESCPRVIINTAPLSATATRLANRFAQKIIHIDEKTAAAWLKTLNKK